MKIDISKEISLNQILSEKIYDDRLFLKIKNEIGTSHSFIKSNQIRKMIIYNRLKNLTLLIEYTSIFENRVYEKKDLKNEIKKFNEKYHFEMSKEIKRKDSFIFKNRLNLCIYELRKYILKKGYKTVDVENVIKLITPEKIFFSVMLDSVINCLVYPTKSDNFNLYVKNNEIIKTNLHDKIIKKIIILLTLLTLNDEQKFHALEVIHDDIPNIINKNPNIYEQISYQLIDIFIWSLSCETRSINFKSKGKVKELSIIEIPEKLIKNIVLPTHIPEIVPPLYHFDNPECLINFSKKINNGISRVVLSKNSKKAFSISQNKKFKINSNCINIFNLIDELDYTDIKDIDINPFIPISVFSHLKDEIDKIKDLVKQDELDQIKFFFKNVKKNNVYIKDIHIGISDQLNIPIDKVEKCIRLYDLYKELEQKRKLIKLHNTIIEFAKIFNGFPIYFIESFDYRLRMYTYSFMFSRNSGIYKYLVSDFKSIKLTDKGLKTMLYSFYKEYPEKNSQLGKLINNEYDIDGLLKWNDENIDIPLKILIKNKSPMYHSLLNLALKDLINNKLRTNFIIELDQRSSSIVLMAITLNDQKLCELCNLISDKTNDPPTYLMEKSKSWYKDKITNISNEIMENNRDLQKKLVMCFCYNSTSYGRFLELKKYINNENDCWIIAKSYPNFINDSLDMLKEKKDKFNKIINYYLENTSDDKKTIEIETVDGCVLSWVIFKENKKTFKKTYFSPVYDKKISYSSKEEKDSLVEDKRKMISSFLPSYIHSLDGSIMRLILLKVNEKLDYTISHLHDSIQFHPNFYDDVMEWIVKVYTENNLEDSININLFNKLIHKIKPGKRDELILLIEDFNFNKQPIVITKEKFNVKGMFRLE